jgi:hypothetical protein
MTIYRLAAGAALGAIVLTSAAPTWGKPRRHSTRTITTGHTRDEEIERLKAQIEGLTARLDADEAAEQAEATRSQAANALSQSQAAQTELAQIAAAPVPPPRKPEPGWWGNTAISGKAFFNVSNINQKSTDLAGVTTDNAQNGTQTELKRFYMAVDHKFNDVFSANFTTDFRYNSNGTTRDVLVYVKKAYLQAKLNPAFTVRLGEADLPWVPFVEGVYGFRFIDPTLIDRTKFGTSTDWGVHVFGGLANGRVGYQVSAINGSGYKALSRSSNTIDLEGRININPIKEITLAVGGYTGRLGKSNDTVNVRHRATRFNALAGFTGKRVRAGLEYFSAKNWNNVITSSEPLPAPLTANDSARGWSAFGSFAFTPKIAVFSRYEWVKPTRTVLAGTNGSAKDHFFNVGINYKPIAPLDFALVYKRDRANNGFINTSNGSIGGLDHGSYEEIGLFGQFVF